MRPIDLINLSIGYDSLVVASGITAAVESGQLTCLLGVNGVGKSTLLRTLAAFQSRLAGDILIMGKSIDDYSDRQLARSIGVVLTEKPDLRNMTVTELVALGRSPYTGFWGTLNADDRRIVKDAISMVGIDHLAKRMIQTLSDGERQKVMIAKALAQLTPIIFLDEPTAFLDYPSKVGVMLLLKRLCREMNKTVFLSTHDLEIAVQTADCLWLMNSGGSQPLSVGTPRRLADDGTLSRYVERGAIHFDRETLTVRIDEE